VAQVAAALKTASAVVLRMAADGQAAAVWIAVAEVAAAGGKQVFRH
jgi:hypothetical protein